MRGDAQGVIPLFYSWESLSGYGGGIFGGAGKRNRQQSLRINQMEEALQYDFIKRAFCSKFRWEGECLEYVLEGYLETMLFYNGSFIICPKKGKPSEVGFYQANPNKIDDMGMPLTYIVTTQNRGGKQANWEVHREDCVYVRDNSVGMVPFFWAQRKAAVIADISRTFEVYASGMKKPSVFMTTSHKKDTTALIAQKMLNNEPYILVEKETKSALGDQDAMLPLGHNSGDLMGLIAAQKAVTGEVLTKLGIVANPSTKSQYVSNDEREDENEFATILAADQKRQRELACEQAKSRLGIDLTCESTSDVLDEEKMEQQKEMQDVESAGDGVALDGKSGDKQQ